MQIGTLVKIVYRHDRIQIGVVKHVDSFQALIVWCGGGMSFVGIDELEVL